MQVCPKCGSNNIKSFSMVYDMYSSDDLSPLGYKCAPPPEPRLGAWVWLFVIASLVVSHMVATLSIFSSYLLPATVVFVISISGMILLWHKTLGASAQLVYRGKRKIWERSWLCLQCNHDFERDIT
jgi:hypothetical protein